MRVTYNSVIITGSDADFTNGVIERMLANNSSMSRIKALTTNDDGLIQVSYGYEHILLNDYVNKKAASQLRYDSSIAHHHYAVLDAEIKSITSAGKVPLIMVSPKHGHDINKQNEDREFSVYVESAKKDSDALPTSEEDFEPFRRSFLYYIKSNDVIAASDLINRLFDMRSRGGCLDQTTIRLMVSCGLLVGNAITSNISPASYDLTLGDEYYYAGEIKTLSERDPFIKIEPGDYALVTSREWVNLPKDMVGRFDVTVGLFCKGVILSNGPQVDPGFRGKLFCLLFNTTSDPVTIKRGEHHATIVFDKMLEPTKPYAGKYQNKDKIMDMLPTSVSRGAMQTMREDITKLQNERRLYAGLSLLMGILAIIVSVYAIFR